MRQPLVVYDAAEGGFLGTVWRTYAATFPRSQGVRSWEDVAAVLLANPSSHAQVWGHGVAAAPLIDGDPPPRDFPWGMAESFWFRSCSVANGPKGRAFMEKVGQEADAVAHLGIIGTWGVQSRLVGIRQLQPAWWGDEVDKNERSAPWLPRTIISTRRTIPRWAFTPS